VYDCIRSDYSSTETFKQRRKERDTNGRKLSKEVVTMNFI
jgi:hypothetical protein